MGRHTKVAKDQYIVSLLCRETLAKLNLQIIKNDNQNNKRHYNFENFNQTIIVQ